MRTTSISLKIEDALKKTTATKNSDGNFHKEPIVMICCKQDECHGHSEFPSITMKQMENSTKHVTTDVIELHQQQNRHQSKNPSRFTNIFFPNSFDVGSSHDQEETDLFLEEEDDDDDGEEEDDDDDAGGGDDDDDGDDGGDGDDGDVDGDGDGDGEGDWEGDGDGDGDGDCDGGDALDDDAAFLHYCQSLKSAQSEPLPGHTPLTL